jgi:hypothetical protein
VNKEHQPRKLSGELPIPQTIAFQFESQPRTPKAFGVKFLKTTCVEYCPQKNSEIFTILQSHNMLSAMHLQKPHLFAVDRCQFAALRPAVFHNFLATGAVERGYLTEQAGGFLAVADLSRRSRLVRRSRCGEGGCGEGRFVGGQSGRSAALSRQWHKNQLMKRGVCRERGHLSTGVRQEPKLPNIEMLPDACLNRMMQKYGLTPPRVLWRTCCVMQKGNDDMRLCGTDPFTDPFMTRLQNSSSFTAPKRPSANSSTLN